DALRAAGADPNRPEPYRKRLVAMLGELDDEALGRFIGGLLAARAALVTREHWCAASLLAGQPCDSEAFDDFRSWVVALGADAYARVLAQPDALADCVPATTQALPALKPLLASTWKVHGKRARTDAMDAAIARACAGVDPHAEDHIGWRYWDAPTSSELERALPRLWTLRGAAWRGGGGDASFVREADIAGLGKVRIGDRLARRGSSETLEVLGITDNAADLPPGARYVGGDDFRYMGRVRLGNGGIGCGQTLSGRFLRWPHEPDPGFAPPIDGADEDYDADAFDARDDAIQARVRHVLGAETRVVYAAYDEDDDGLPVDNLDDVAHEGQIRFVEVDAADGERFESDVLTNPTWLDLARVAHDMIATLGYEDHVYLEGFRVVKKARGGPATGRLEMGS
ncbi:MAG TPA: DUF4240 domain-containing protein, partial [Xanthomonadales bacterium]|nr:DUF4240 domain-containing protein [Xanthomonadales bacterium]